MTSHIRIPAVAPTVQMVADGAAKTFEFPFPIFSATDLDVWVGDAAVTSGFAVRGAGSSDGGAITFAAAPANGQRVTIRRRQTYARTDDFLDERAPTPHELNDAVDQNVAAIQELADESALAVKRSVASDLSRPVSLILPEPEAGKVIGWNGSANALANLVQVDVSDMLRKSQNLADLPDKAQARINLGLDSAATHAASDFATAAQGAKADSALQPSVVGVSVQAHDADLDWVAGNLSAAGKALLDDADAAAQRSTLGLDSAATHAASDFATAAQGAKADSALQPSVVGVSVQAHDADLDWVAGNLSAAGKALLDDADAAAQRSTLGLGSAATKEVGTGANQVVQLDASARLPAVDGSSVSNLNASSLASGTVSAARLGSGSANASSFLRGDGTWATIASIGNSGFGNAQTFTASGTFTVPAGVTIALVMAVGGGGGGGNNNSNGGAGGASSFGTMVYGTGGGGGAWANLSGGGTQGAPGYGYTGAGVIGAGTVGTDSNYYGKGGTGGGGAGGINGYWGGSGGIGFGLCAVTPGSTIPVTIGNGGSSYGGAAQSGIVIVRY